MAVPDSEGKRLVYNLEFPSYCQTLDVYGNRFARVSGYARKVTRLQHRIKVLHEFDIAPTTGEHVQTAVLHLPKNEYPSVLPWAYSATASDDIVHLLSLFTGRNVFVLDQPLRTDEILTADPRQWIWGKVLRASIPYRVHPRSPAPLYASDIGFEETLNAVYQLLRSATWQADYENGRYLFPARQALSLHELEPAFRGCWTALEHIFAVRHRHRMPPGKIRSTNVSDKISWLLKEYELQDTLDSTAKRQIGRWVGLRDSLVHDGTLRDRKARTTSILVIRITEWVITKSLGLNPSNALNTIETLARSLTTEADGIGSVVRSQSQGPEVSP